MSIINIKDKILKIKEICANCDEIADDGYCRDIPLNRKILMGCGKWGEINDDDFYKELHMRLKLREVVDDILKMEVNEDVDE